MAEPQYTSTLTGPELDAALRDAAGVDVKVEQAQSAAQQAAQSASSAQGYASAAGSSASAASTAAGTATSKAQDAQTAAEQAADSATQAAQSAASITGSVSTAQSAAEDAESAAQKAQAAQTAAEDAAERAAAAADFDPADFATAEQGAKADTAVQPSDILNLIYPVGAIYISYSSTSPAILFGGSWTRIQSCFLLAAGGEYEARSVGGEARHTLTQAELPAYQLSVSAGENLVKSQTGSDPAAYTTTVQSGWGLPNWNAVSISVASGGSDQPHNNMPPYLAVYVWRRTA